MDNLKKTEKLGKQVKYKFGYSNLTFDLWIILHMTECNAPISDKNGYLKSLNKAYDENFQSMREYKRENNFKRCLEKLQLSNVLHAIAHAKAIMKRNEENGYTLQEYRGYKYYKENPSLTIWEAIEVILMDCSLI